MAFRRALIALLIVSGVASHAQKVEIDRAQPGESLGLWRLSHDPAAEDHANYHQHQCWSHDGRYLTYRHCPAVRGSAPEPYAGFYRPEVRVYDFLTNADCSLGLGITMLPGASWANQHNWLFFLELQPEDRGFPPEGGAPVILVDLETGTRTKLATGFDQLGGVDSRDQWLYGGIKDRTRTPAFRTARTRLTPGGVLEELTGVIGFQWVTNPAHPLFSTRHDDPEHPFGSTVSWWSSDGQRRENAMLVLESAHMTWQGNGEHFLFGDGLPRGRRWNEPAPSNVHVLASGRAGNLSACGRNGRLVVSDSAMFDLRSGDSWEYRSFLPGPLKPSRDFYPIFDGEAKGSPDGTKVAFTARYDLQKGPLTQVTEVLQAPDRMLRVRSTEGFPERGTIVVWTEVMEYESKTATSFERLTRGAHGTRISAAPVGTGVTDFTHHLLNDADWKKVQAVGNDIRLGIADPASPLLRQRARDVYVAVVRRPDRPWLRIAGDTVQIIPGESHYEIAGYHLALGGRRITNRPLRAGEQVSLITVGAYSATAIEWSGLESESSTSVELAAPTRLTVLPAPPADFAWTTENWLVREKETSAEEAAEAVRETVHRYDGVIAREWYKKGILTQHHDLNSRGKAIRRLTYEGGKLALRDYYNRDNQHVSRQVFAPDGYITETISLSTSGGGYREIDHWWFGNATPVRRITGGQEYRKDGDQWTGTPLPRPDP